MSIFTGSGVAITTPFNEDGSIDYATLERQVEFQIKNNTDAIIVVGTTGEASTLDDDEHLDCIKFVIDKVNKRVPVIAGTGSNNTEHALMMSKEAEKYGADGLLLVTPYYNKTTQKGLIEHYSYIANNVNIPIVLYNVPSRTGLNIAPKTVLELSKIDNIVALKEASGNLSHVAEVASLVGESIDIYSGNDDQIVPILSLGGKGVISVVANILPQETHDIVHKYLSGDVKGSRDLQLNLLPLIKSLFLEVNPIPVKSALSLMGYGSSSVRRPLVAMSDENLEVLKSEMKKANII